MLLRPLTLCFGAGLLAVAAVSGCEPPPVNDGRFWNRDDAGAATGSGGLGALPGSGGNGVSPPSGITGDGSGGSAPGSGGNAADSGTGGTLGSGGSAETGGRTGATGGRGGSAASTGTPDGGVASGGRASTGGTGSGGAGSGGMTGGALTGTLQVSVTTKAAGGKYAPDNVGAIWIADSGDKFVKSLYVWGSQRRRNLSTWTSATSAAGLANNVVDAVTAATMKSHGVRSASWNGTNTSKVLVPDGTYKVCFELRDGGGQSQCVEFMKSRVAQTVKPADTATFTMRSIGFSP